jgi:hypothetical protein
MTDVEIFDREVIRLGLGPRLLHTCNDAKCAYSQIRINTETLISSARQHLPKLPPIYFDFIQNSRINAFAFKSDGKYFIGLNYGTVYMLELIFMRMLADSRLFDFVGNPDAEDSNLPPLTGYTPEAYKMYQAGHTAKPPKTRPRHFYAADLFFDAIRFLIGHEIAHITLGHVDYMQSKIGTALVAEAGWKGIGSQAQLTIERQCMEAQADMRSVHSAIQSLKLLHEIFKLEKPRWADSPPSEGLQIFGWAFAMNTLFRLFGDIRFNPSQLETETYPPLPLRRAMASNAAYMFVMSGWDAALKEKVLHSLATAMKYTEFAFATILGEKVSTAGLTDAYNPLSHAHGKQLIGYSLKLQKALDPFAYETTFVATRIEEIT